MYNLNYDEIHQIFENPSGKNLEKLIEFSESKYPILAISSVYTNNRDITQLDKFQLKGENWKLNASNIISRDKYISKHRKLDSEMITEIYKNTHSNKISIETDEFKLSINAINLVEIAKFILKNNDFKYKSQKENRSLEFDEDNFVKFFMHEYALKMFYLSKGDPLAMIQPPKERDSIEFKIRNFYQFYEKLPIGALFLYTDYKLKEGDLKDKQKILKIGRKNEQHLIVPRINQQYSDNNIPNIGFDDNGKIEIELSIPNVEISFDKNAYTCFRENIENCKFSAKLNNKLLINSNYSVGVEYNSKEELNSFTEYSIEQMLKNDIDERGYFELHSNTNIFSNINYIKRIENFINFLKLPESLYLETGYREGYNVFSRNLSDIFLKHLGIK